MLLFRFTLVLLIVNVLAFSAIGLSFFRNLRVEKASAQMYKDINSLVVLVMSEPTSPSDAALAQYRQISGDLKKNRWILRLKTLFPEPEYQNSDENEEYRAVIREYATAARTLINKITRRSYYIISIMIFNSCIASAGILIIMIRWRRHQLVFNRELHSGFDRLEMILKYQNPPSQEKVEYKIDEIDELNAVIERISSDEYYNREVREATVSGNLNNFLDDIFEKLGKRMSCDRIAIAFLDSSENLIAETAVATYSRMSLEPGFRENINNSSLPDLLKAGKSRIINDLPSYAKGRKVSEATAKILHEGINSSMTIPMFFGEKCLGFFFVSSLSLNAYNDETLNYTVRLVNLIKQNVYIEFLLQEIISEITNAFVTLMHEKDNETSNHIIRMSEYSYMIARSYHEHINPLSPRLMREIRWFSPLHDIGKVGIPDAILLKEGPLDDSEMTVMKSHVNIGMRVMEKMNSNLLNVASFPLMQTAIEIISGHHEKFDGSGYPFGLEGRDIPLAGRIVALADVFDALTSKRPYKAAFSIEKSVSIIEEEMGANFDPNVINAFKLCMNDIRHIYEKFKEV